LGEKFISMGCSFQGFLRLSLKMPWKLIASCRSFGLLDMECNRKRFVELECGVGFEVSTWGFWSFLWNVNSSKFEVGCCIVGASF
jgi:hypothetical protein